MDNHQMIKEYFTITPEQYIRMRIKSLSSQDLYIQQYLLNNAIKDQQFIWKIEWIICMIQIFLLLKYANRLLIIL